jgi:serine/threonine-protein kinase RsbW
MKPFEMTLLSSVPESINNVCDDSYGNMLVAITEAVNNAIYHGNKGNPDKQVKISYLLDNDKIAFYIADEGSGFDYFNIPDPTAPENIDKPNGRGIFLMKQLADQLIFSDNGKTVELYFKIN